MTAELSSKTAISFLSIDSPFRRSRIFSEILNHLVELFLRRASNGVEYQPYCIGNEDAPISVIRIENGQTISNLVIGGVLGVLLAVSFERLHGSVRTAIFLFCLNQVPVTEPPPQLHAIKETSHVDVSFRHRQSSPPVTITIATRIGVQAERAD